MNSATAKANALESRLITFAAAILSVSAKLPKTPQARHISNQILRSGTAAAANYGEARGAGKPIGFHSQNGNRP
jgi:four helix bundle protein